MLTVKNLNTHYGNIHALKGIDLEVAQGEIVTLIGSNGAGKTTTLKTIIANVLNNLVRFSAFLTIFKYMF